MGDMYKELLMQYMRHIIVLNDESFLAQTSGMLSDEDLVALNELQEDIEAEDDELEIEEEDDESDED